MNTWFISDTHFFHDNILEFSNRPFTTVGEMNEALVENWNAVVQPTDVVYHLGDFAMGREFDALEAICGSLNGFVHLIPGNHDTNKKLEIYGRYFTIEPPILHLRKPDVILCHYPIGSWHGAAFGRIHLHGHSHGTYVQEGRLLDVGVDVEPKYRPKSWEEIQDILSRTPYKQRDHHAEIIKEGVEHYLGTNTTDIRRRDHNL